MKNTISKLPVMKIDGTTVVPRDSTLSIGDATTVYYGDGSNLTGISGAGDVSKVGTPVDNQVGVWTGNGTIEGTTGLTYDGANLQLTGDIGSTGTKITKGWFTDLTVTNAIAGSVTGNATTVTNATLTTALTVDTGTVGLTGNVANSSVLTIGAGAVSVSGSNTGDQTSIVGITGTKTQFDTAVTDGNFLYSGDITQYTDEMAQDAVGGILIDSPEINFTYTDATPSITAVIVASSIDEAKLDVSVNASLDLADSALQVSAIGVSIQAYSAVLDGTTASYTIADEDKVDFISVTQAVNLDTMESDINTNNSKVTNATHTGDATGATDLTVVKINGTLMSGLATGILKNTTTTGVPSIAVAGDFPTLNQNTTGSAATVSTITGLAPDTATTQATQAAITSAANLATVGTIGTGVWQGTAIGDTYISSAATWDAKMDNPMTTAADIIYGGASGAPTRLANGTDGQYLKSNGTTVAPSWETIAGGGDMVLADIQSVTGLKTFDTTKLAVKGSSTGTTAIASANASATSYTATLKAETGTLAYTSDITGTNSGTNTGDNTICTSGTATTAVTLATTRAIYGNNFDGSAALTQIIASTYGGTGNGFTKFTGPATAERTFTLPNANATLLYSGGDAGTPSALVGTNISGTASGLTAGAVTGVTLASGSLTLAGADALTLTTSAATDVTLPTTGTLLANVSEDASPELGGEMDAGAHTIGFTQQSATGDGTTTIDWKLGNKFEFTFGAANETFTFTAPSNPCNILLKMIQDGTGSRTATWPATVKWPAGTAPTLTTTASAVDIISFYFDGINYYGSSTLAFA